MCSFFMLKISWEVFGLKQSLLEEMKQMTEAGNAVRQSQQDSWSMWEAV